MAGSSPGRKACAQRRCSGACASTAVEATAQKLRALLSSEPCVSSQVRSKLMKLRNDPAAPFQAWWRKAA